MKNSLNTNSPDAMYTRSLNDESDLYVIFAGPNTEYGAIALRHIEVKPGTELSEIDTSTLSHYEPQEPHLLTYEELAVQLLGRHALIKEITERETHEFDALIGFTATPTASAA